MQLLARINAGGTTVVMATHEAGFVDQMQRRVIELVDGEMVRDERHGGYGDTSGIPSLAPEPERGAAAVAALTAVLEVQRETALSPSAAVSSAYGHGGTADIAARAAATAAAAAVHAVTQAADTSTDEETADAASPGVEPVEQPAVVAEEAPAAKAPKPADAPAPRTQPVPLVDIAEVDVAELGLADRLGLGRDRSRRRSGADLVRVGLVLSEALSGLRRNASMVISVVLVTFVSLTFVGAAILMQMQIGQMKDYWADRAQVAIYMCTAISQAPTCTDGVATDSSWQRCRRSSTARRSRR